MTSEEVGMHVLGSLYGCPKGLLEKADILLGLLE